MGLLDRFRPPPAEDTSDMTLREVLATHNLVDVLDNGTVIVSELPPHLRETRAKQLADPSTAEMGYSFVDAATSYGSYMKEDYNPDLRGVLGLRKFDEMRRSDAQIRATLRLVKTPVIAARWYAEPASDSPQDRMIAKFVWDNLTKWMTVSWPQVLTEALLMLDFGCWVFEKVYDYRIVDGAPRVIWRKFASRHPADIQTWNYDENGGLQAVTMATPSGIERPVQIPIEKLAVFTFDKEAGNAQGISILRSAYQPWYFKNNLYKIDAIQKERHGVGVPVIKLPATFSLQDKSIADQLGRNLRTNEKAHITTLPGWEISFAKLEGQPVDVLASIEHHDMQIAKNILAPFLNESSGVGAEERQTLFLKGTRFIADIIRDVFNKYCIPQLVDYNWPDVTDYPTLRARRIGDTQDWKTISFAVRNFIGAGVIQVDDMLEAWVRDEMDLPPVDKATLRAVKTPQVPRIGPPKQAPASNMKTGPGTTNVGQNNNPGGEQVPG